MLFKRYLSNTIAIQARFPALQTRISRNEFKRNQKRITELKDKLQDKYREIGRDKRTSPLTQRRSPSIDSQPPKPIEKVPLIQPFLYDPIHGCLDVGETIQQTEKVDSENKQNSIRDFVIAKRVEKEIETTLTLDENAIPPIVKKKEIELKTQKGPFYQHGVLPSETEFILRKTPLVTQDVFQEQATQQPELVRRILSLSTANNEEIKKFNTQRVIEMFQRFPGDTGSSEVQAAVMTIKIMEMKKHLEMHKKDKSTKRRLEAWLSKRIKMLKYLKRQDVKKAVYVCEQLGVSAASIS